MEGTMGMGGGMRRAGRKEWDICISINTKNKGENQIIRKVIQQGKLKIYKIERKIAKII